MVGTVPRDWVCGGKDLCSWYTERVDRLVLLRWPIGEENCTITWPRHETLYRGREVIRYGDKNYGSCPTLKGERNNMRSHVTNRVFVLIASWTCFWLLHSRAVPLKNRLNWYQCTLCSPKHPLLFSWINPRKLTNLNENFRQYAGRITILNFKNTLFIW